MPTNVTFAKRDDVIKLYVPLSKIEKHKSVSKISDIFENMINDQNGGFYKEICINTLRFAIKSLQDKTNNPTLTQLDYHGEYGEIDQILLSNILTPNNSSNLRNEYHKDDILNIHKLLSELCTHRHFHQSSTIMGGVNYTNSANQLRDFLEYKKDTVNHVRNIKVNFANNSLAIGLKKAKPDKLNLIKDFAMNQFSSCDTIEDKTIIINTFQVAILSATGKKDIEFIEQPKVKIIDLDLLKTIFNPDNLASKYKEALEVICTHRYNSSGLTATANKLYSWLEKQRNFLDITLPARSRFFNVATNHDVKSNIVSFFENNEYTKNNPNLAVDTVKHMFKSVKYNQDTGALFFRLTKFTGLQPASKLFFEIIVSGANIVDNLYAIFYNLNNSKKQTDFYDYLKSKLSGSYQVELPKGKNTYSTLNMQNTLANAQYVDHNKNTNNVLNQDSSLLVVDEANSLFATQLLNYNEVVKGEKKEEIIPEEMLYSNYSNENNDYEYNAS